MAVALHGNYVNVRVLGDKMPVMIVTGGSRGIGAAVVELAALRGYDLCIGYRRNHAAAERMSHAVQSAGMRAVTVNADIGSEEGVQKLFSACVESFGSVDVLVNNAALVGQAGHLVSINANELGVVLRTNVLGTLFCCREAVRKMAYSRGGNGGTIVNISSIASRLGSPEVAVHYAATKGAIDTLTVGLAKEVASEGIRVNAIRPGIIDTELHASVGIEVRARTQALKLPIARMGRAAEVAEAVLWLASDAASYVTGAILDVSGGA